jgi:hypothetical protein
MTRVRSHSCRVPSVRAYFCGDAGVRVTAAFDGMVLEMP